MANTEEMQERPAINTLNMWALSLAMLSFVVPVILSVPAIIIAAVNRRRLAGDDIPTVMNRKLAKLAQVSALFTIVLAAIYFWRFGWS